MVSSFLLRECVFEILLEDRNAGFVLNGSPIERIAGMAEPQIGKVVVIREQPRLMLVGDSVCSGWREVMDDEKSTIL